MTAIRCLCILPVLMVSSTAHGKTEDARAWKTAANFAACVVKAAGGRELQALDAPFPTLQTGNEIAKILKPDCLTDASNLKLPKVAGRGMLFAALYRKRFMRIGLSSISSEPVKYPLASNTSDVEGLKEYQSALTFGDCVARAAPDATRALLLAEVDSEAESSSITALMPAMSNCVASGAQLKLDKHMMRSFISEPPYRLTAREELASSAERVVH